MVFSSLTFIYLFLPGVLLLYFCVPTKFRNAVLLASSLFFYFCGEQIYLLLMAGETLLTYVAGRLLEILPDKAKKVTLAVFLVLSFGLLGLFKYADLIPGTVNGLAGREIFTLLRLPLPIGISFYVFQSVSYGIDVYRGKYPAEKNLLNLSLYVSFFPQLIAGPVVRFETVSENLKYRTHSIARLSEGLFRFTLGLGKKVLIADRLYAFCDTAAAAASPSLLLSWTEGLAFLLYVYFDFSGYSDMAIGLARCFGFDLPENFDYPLISTGFREFWRRWHISLGSWFRDYVYIPLGGSRKGLLIHLRNLLTVWVLTGLWHGASLNFVLWGLSFGIMLIAEVLLEKTGLFKKKKIPAVLKHILVLTLTVLFFVWFRFTDLRDALTQYGRMFGTVPLWTGSTAYLLKGFWVLLSMACLGATPLPKILYKKAENSAAGRVLAPFLRSAFIVFILIFVTAYLVDGSFSPFLYFRF
ncbi:MAG: MBOAT family protein [Lachnospiraceae bacterium]|nr:MBOAT family protein [Lachnospiraceae bacterium]